MRNILLPTLITVCLSVTSCEKEKTTTELLTDGRWQLSTLTIDPGIIVSGVVITNYYSQLHEYDKDNTSEFKADGTYILDEGAIKQHPDDPQTREGQWVLSANEDLLTIYMNEDTTVYTFKALTEEAMTLTYSQRDTATDINYTLTGGFVKY